MKTYLIPVSESYDYHLNYFRCIYANSSHEAYDKIKNLFVDRQISSDTNTYEVYEGVLPIPKVLFHKDEKDDILNSVLNEKISQGESEMGFFNVNWNNFTNDIAAIASPEEWSNNTYPNNGILANYMIHTYEKLKSEGNVVITKNYGLFNTGLFTKYYEAIYAYSDDPKSVEFLTSYGLGSLKVNERPERANYFENPDLLLFDWHYPINIQYKHILDDEKNKKRIPDEILNSGNVITILDGAINTMKKRVSSNYKLAVPQYFSGQIQLLLPLCLKSDNIPDLALAVTKIGDYYQGHTCLTLDMAYNNARLIAKPESNWLMP